MRTFWCAAALALLSLPVGAETVYYRSNSLGVALERIEGGDGTDERYVLAVDSVGGTEVRRLFEGGVETDRWEWAYDADGQLRGVRHFEAGELAEVSLYEQTGDVAELLSYRDGELFERTVYRYSSFGLRQVEVLDAGGASLYRIDYALSADGRLREVRRTNADGRTEVSHYTHGDTGLSSESHAAGGSTYVNRYDRLTRLALVEQWQDDAILIRERWTYRGDTGVPEKVESRDFRTGETHTRVFDRQGRLDAEWWELSGERLAEVRVYRDAEGRIERRTSVGGEGVEEWFYAYDEAGALAKEEYLMRGTLERVTVYTGESSRFEELYRGGEVFLRVYYEGDTKVKEHFVEDGRTVHERVFADNGDQAR
jgi:hypothetical protein